VDHDGRLDAKGAATLVAGFVVWCVRLYNGVSEGDKRNKWCDIEFTRQCNDLEVIYGPDCLTPTTEPNMETLTGFGPLLSSKYAALLLNKSSHTAH